ncbi:unnamed protein product [Rhizophagus irregularis]|nr:unnamed protein product [Rhizophagus irregularis]
MNITENYIGYDAFVSYLIKVSYSIESIEYIYYEFLSPNQDIIISSLNSLTNSSKALDLNKWQNFDFIWYNRFLKAAKNLFEQDIFIAIKKKIIEERFDSKIKLQIFWQKIIKEFNKKNFPETSQSDLEVIKECDKKNLILAETSQPDILTENYIGYDALDLNNWKNFNFTWYNRFLKAAKNLFEQDIFIAIKKKIQEEYFYFYSKEKLQIFWQTIIKEFNKKNNFPETSQSDLPKKMQEVIKECDKKILILAEISQPDTLLPKKTSKDFIKNLSETLQPDLQVIKKYEKENLIFAETSQPDVLQPDVLQPDVKIPIENHFEFTNFCYDILHELENKSYAKSYTNKSYKHINLKLKNNHYTSLEEFEKDIRLIFCNCYIYNNIESEDNNVESENKIRIILTDVL